MTRNAAMQSLLLANIVAKVLLGWRTKISRAADAPYAPRREGPYRFTQNRSRTSVGVLKKRRSSREKINFREIFTVARFSTFAKISALFGHAAAPRRQSAVEGGTDVSRDRG
jgi:hypothetical protein